MERISYRQAIFLMLMLIPVMGHIIITPCLYQLSGRDSWIAVVLALPLGFIIWTIIVRLHSLNPRMSFVEMLEKAFGRGLGKILSLSLIAYFLYMLVITFYALYDYIQVVFLPDTSRWIILITFYLLVLYGTSLGIESITRTSESVILIIITVGTLIFLFTFNMKDYSNLFPVFEQGSSRVLKGVWLMSAVYAEFIIVLMFSIRKDKPKDKSLFFNASLGILIITYSILSTVISGLTIFGEAQVVNMTYPPLAILRLVSIGFLNRLDIYMAFTLVISAAVRMAAYQTALLHVIKQAYALEKKWLINLLAGLILFIIVAFVIKDHLQFAKLYLTLAYQYFGIISVALLFSTWLILEIKNRLI